MKSIRYQLLFWLLPSFVTIAFLAGSSLYLSEKLRLDTNIDNELDKLARAVKLSNKMPPTRFGGPVGIGKNIVINTKLILGDEYSEFYLQLWDETGNILSKSESLAEQQLSYPNKPSQIDELGSGEVNYNSKLISGDYIRVHSFTMWGGPRRDTVNVSVAISKAANNQQLAKVAVKLIIGGTFCCFLLAGILIFAIRRTLIPIEDLSEQVTQVEVGSLHNRLIEADVPTEIKPLVDRLNQLLGRLEQSFARERQFNSDLAHELHTPLAAIRTTSEVALKWPEQSSSEDYRYIAESSAQLQQTIDSLLSLARIENSGAETLSEEVNIFTAVEECLSLQLNRIQERNLAIDLCVDKTLCLKSDPRLLRIIISNLVNNAVEYTPVNSEIIISSEDSLNSASFLNKKQSDTVLTVINSAPNLNEEDLKTMFNRMWRKDASRTGSKHVGLGLSIAHTAAQAINLKLTAKIDRHQQLQMNLKQV